MTINEFIDKCVSDNVTELVNLCFHAGWFNKDYLCNVEDVNEVKEWYLMTLDFYYLIDGLGVPVYEDFEHDIHLWAKCSKGSLYEDPVINAVYEYYKKYNSVCEDYKKVPVELLEQLKDVAEGYKTMAGALVGESEETIGVETYRGASACKDDYEMKMLKLIDEITGTLGV